jgi:hypothetical protein
MLEAPDVDAIIVAASETANVAPIVQALGAQKCVLIGSPWLTPSPVQQRSSIAARPMT